MNEVSDLFIQIGRWQYYLLALVATGFIIFVHSLQHRKANILNKINSKWNDNQQCNPIGIFNLCLAIPLAMRYGGIGCAFATGLAMFLGNGLVMNWFYSTQIGLDIKRFWQQIARITVAVMGCLIIGYVMNGVIDDDSIGVFVCKIGIYVLLYAIILHFIAMTDIEKGKIQKIFRGIR